MISLLPDEDQVAIVNSLESLLTDAAPLDRLQRPDSEVALWAELAALGMFSLPLHEIDGGMDAGWGTLALIFRQLGRHLVSPSVAATMLAVKMLGQHADVRDAVVAGRARVAFAMSIWPPDPAGKRFLSIDAPSADLLLVWQDKALTLVGNDATAPLVTGTDMALSLGRIDGVNGAGMATGDGDLATAAQLLIAALTVGLADAARDMAVGYAMTRQQFGRPIAEFQAIKHHCANMAVAAEVAWAQTIFAALRHESGAADAEQLSHAARLLSADAAIGNAETNIQVHGGIGFTAEALPHLLVRRAQLLARLGGDRREHREAVLSLQDTA